MLTSFVELGHVLADGMPLYPGLPSPSFSAVLTHADSRARYGGQAEFYIGKADLPCNLGTYLEAPFHRFADGDDLSRIPLASVANVAGVVVDAAVPPRAVTLDIAEKQLTGRAVLVRTGWDERWGTERYWEPGPFLAEETIELLILGRPALVGVDFWNVDDTEDPARPAHTRLLREGILVVEHLCGLASLPPSGFRFSLCRCGSSAAPRFPCARSRRCYGRDAPRSACSFEASREAKEAVMRA